MTPLPTGWRWASPDELGHPRRPAIKAGPFGSALKKSDYVPSGYKIYGQEQVIADDCSIGDYYVDDTKYGVLRSCAVEEGDILVTLVGTFGQVTIVPRGAAPGIINPRLIRLSFDPKLLYGTYFKHFFRSSVAQRQLEARVHGGTMGVLNASDLRELRVPLPPLSEQKRIAAILDKADAIRRKRQEAIRSTEELLRAAFLEMFGDPVTNPKGWEVRKLGELIRVRSGDALSARDMASDGGYAVYGGNGISGRHSKFMFEKPVIVIGRVGVYCGVVHRTEPNSWVTDNALFVAEKDEALDDDYLEWALRLANFNQYAGRAAQPLISAGRIYPVEIAVPPGDAQMRFSRLLRQNQQALARARDACTTADELAVSLTQRAFSGKL